MTTAVVKFGEDALVSIFEGDQILSTLSRPVKDGVLDELYKVLSGVALDEIIFLVRGSVFEPNTSGMKAFLKLPEGKTLGVAQQDYQKLEALSQRVGAGRFRVNCVQDLYSLVEMETFLGMEDHYNGNISLAAVEKGKVIGMEICKPPVVESVLRNMGKRYGIEEIVSLRLNLTGYDKRIRNIPALDEQTVELLRTSIAVMDLEGGWNTKDSKVVAFKPKETAPVVILDADEDLTEDEDLLVEEPVVFAGLSEKDKNTDKSEIKSDFKSFLSRRSGNTSEEKKPKANKPSRKIEKDSVDEDSVEEPLKKGREKLSSILIGTSSVLLAVLVLIYGLGYYVDWKSADVVEDPQIKNEIIAYTGAVNSGSFMFSEKYYSVKMLDSFGLVKLMEFTPTGARLQVNSEDQETLSKFVEELQGKYTVSVDNTVGDTAGEASTTWLTLE